MFEGQIARGVQFLDMEFGVNWVFDIDLQDLDLSSACHCVIGQLYMDAVYDDLINDSSLGFDISVSEDDVEDDPEADYFLLTQEWRETIAQLIEERRGTE